MFDSENTDDLSGIVMPRFDFAQSKKIETEETKDNSIAAQISTVFSASGISAIMSHPEMDSLPTAGQQHVQRKFENRKNGTFNNFSSTSPISPTNPMETASPFSFASKVHFTASL